jgi:UDP-glucose 4-epimerase
MRILVTGGAGFIGSHIADAALAKGYEVCVVDNLSSGRRENVPSRARFAELDICDTAGLDRLFSEFKPQVIAHQAAQTSVTISTREPLRDAQVNVLGSLNIANAAVTHQVERLVFASTGGAIYGEISEGAAKEGDPMTPLSPYGCSKLAFENYLPYYRLAFGLRCTVLRYGNVYGPRQDPHGEAGVVAIFAQRLRDKQPLQVNAKSQLGDDGCIRDYVFVEDVVRANMAAIEGRIEHAIMNVGTGSPTTTRMLIDGLKQVLGEPSEVKAGAKRAGDIERSLLDASRLRAALGEPVGLEEGLRKTAHWFLARSH